MRPLLLLALLMLSLNVMSQRRSYKSAIGATLSFPWINNFAYYDYNLAKPYSKSGFVGLGASAFYKDNKQKVSLSLGLLGTLPVPMGPYDVERNNYTQVFSVFLEGTYHKRVFPRINLIGGMHYMEHEYSYWKTDSTASDNFTDFTGGLTAGAEYLFGRKNFSLALFYRPGLITFTGTRKYRHVISLDARFDINVFRKY
jgi:hypothetical protein